jgi:2-polyprenyl-6-methoxyphenol hydroxylase-like FAD-dependent oxidoreductase
MTQLVKYKQFFWVFVSLGVVFCRTAHSGTEKTLIQVQNDLLRNRTSIFDIAQDLEKVIQPELQPKLQIEEYRSRILNWISRVEVEIIDIENYTLAQDLGDRVRVHKDRCDDLWIHKTRDELKPMNEICHKIFELNSVLQNKIETLSNRRKLYPEPIDRNNSLRKRFAKLQGNQEFLAGLSALQRLVDLRSARDLPGLRILDPNDVNQVEKLRSMLTLSPQTDEVKDWIKYLTKEIDLAQSILKNKKEMLIHLFNGMPDLDPSFESWNSTDKISFLVRSHQILENPFEYQIQVKSLLKDLQYGEGKKIKKFATILLSFYRGEPSYDFDNSGVLHLFTGFMEKYHPVEKFVDQLAKTPDLKSFLHQQKLVGLREIMEFHSKNYSANENVGGKKPLIVGAGPGGLIRALYLALQGKEFQLIEKRLENMRGRDNVVTVGQGGPEEMNILFFLGVVSALRRDGDKASFSHLKPHLMEVPISDIERELKVSLNSLFKGSQPIQYGKVIQSIEVDSQQGAKVTLVSTDSENQLEEVVYPSVLFANDGANSQTRKLLGVFQVPLSDTTLFAISFLDRKGTEYPEALSQWVVDPREGISKVATTYGKAAMGVVKSFISGDTVQDSVIQEVKGPAAIFRIPSKDYIFHDVLPDERIEINQKRSNIAHLKAEKQILSMNNGDHFTQLNAKINTIEQEKNEKESELKEYLKVRSLETHSVMDVASRIVRRQHHRMFSVEHERTDTVDSTITRSEVSLVMVGNMPAAIRGDASHTTDATSGFGAKTAIEEVIADILLMNSQPNEVLSPLEQASLNTCHETFSIRMRNVGFKERLLYERGTEKFERYLHDLKAIQILTEEEGTVLKKLSAMRSRGLLDQGALRSSSLFLMDLSTKLILSLGGEKKVWKAVSTCELDAGQNQILKKMLTLLHDPDMTQFQTYLKDHPVAIRDICSVLAFNDYWEGAVLGVLYWINTEID